MATFESVWPMIKTCDVTEQITHQAEALTQRMP